MSSQVCNNDCAVLQIFVSIQDKAFPTSISHMPALSLPRSNPRRYRVYPVCRSHREISSLTASLVNPPVRGCSPNRTSSMLSQKDFVPLGPILAPSVLLTLSLLKTHDSGRALVFRNKLNQVGIEKVVADDGAPWSTLLAPFQTCVFRKSSTVRTKSPQMFPMKVSLHRLLRTADKGTACLLRTKQAIIKRGHSGGGSRTEFGR